MPQHAVAFIGNHKWDGALGISLHQFQRRAFEVENALLILAHAEKLFLRIGFKPGIRLKRAADIAANFPRGDAHMAGKLRLAHIAHEFFQQKLAILVEKADFPAA